LGNVISSSAPKQLTPAVLLVDKEPGHYFMKVTGTKGQIIMLKVVKL